MEDAGKAFEGDIAELMESGDVAYLGRECPAGEDEHPWRFHVVVRRG